MSARTTLPHRDGSVDIEEMGGGRRRVNARASDSSIFVPVSSCETAYPVPLIEAILAVKSPAFLCDEILREEDPRYVERNIRFEVLSYAAVGEFAGKRLLDFGCGAGASSAVLARLLPGAEIVGVDIDEGLVRAARLRAEHYRLERAAFFVSSDPMTVPREAGEFDHILLSAVYEHLLPAERAALLPALWIRLRAGGVLFVNQTPYRYSPVESHSTHLPLLNYLPAPAAFRYARLLSRRVRGTDRWEDLLRKGIRGGSPGEILGILRRAGGAPALLGASAAAMRLCRRLTGATVTPSLSLAIRKGAAEKNS